MRFVKYIFETIVIVCISKVKVDLPVTNMDAAGKTLAERAISSIKERGHTNLSGGLIGALQVNGLN